MTLQTPQLRADHSALIGPFFARDQEPLFAHLGHEDGEFSRSLDHVLKSFS